MKVDFSNTTLKPRGRVRNCTRHSLCERSISNLQIKTVVIIFSVTVNIKYYLEALDRLRKRMMGVRAEIADDWTFHRDNEPARTALSFREIFAKKVHSRACTGPLVSTFVTLWLFLFPKLKSRVKIHHFQTTDSLQEAVTDTNKRLIQLTSSPVQSMLHQRRQYWFRRRI